jgi:hypothetical protein
MVEMMGTSTPSSVELDRRYLFVNYVTRYMLEFAATSQPAIEDDEIAQWIRGYDEWFQSWRDVSSSSSWVYDSGFVFEKDAELLYMLSANGYDRLVRIMLAERGTDVNAQGGLYGIAL